VLGGVDEKEEKSEQDCLVERDEVEGRERDKRSRCSKEGSEAAGRNADVLGGDPRRSDDRDGAERLSDEPE